MRKFSLSLLLLFQVVVTTSTIFAADAAGVATSTIIEDENAEDGQIVCESESGFILCDKEYNPQTYGVIVENPNVVFYSDSNPLKKPVVTNGTVQVQVTSANGPIMKGDYVSSSNTPGVGQKAIRSGYALGTAQTDWTDPDPSKIGKVYVNVQPKPAIMTARASANLIDLIKSGIDATFLSPVLALRYTLASLVTICSVAFAFWFFARAAHTGVEAIGRNPLAGKTIQVGILFNVIITLGVMGVGLALAYLLLVI